MNVILKNNIDFNSYNSLRQSVDWVPVSERQFDLVMGNSVFFTAAFADGKAVGMTRVAGDGGYTFTLCDVIVHPDFQHKGIGSRLVKKALEHIDKITMPGETTMILLVAAKGKEPFYKKFGFIERPNEDRGAGMYIQKMKEMGEDGLCQ